MTERLQPIQFINNFLHLYLRKAIMPEAEKVTRKFKMVILQVSHCSILVVNTPNINYRELFWFVAGVVKVMYVTVKIS